MLKHTLLIVDCNNLAHRAKHVVGDLEYRGIPTGIIFGFLNQFYHIVKQVLPSRVVFAWDSRESFRRLIFPGYKSGRKIMDPEEGVKMFRQFDALYESILPYMGFSNVLRAEGYEADDIIGQLCARASVGGLPGNIIAGSNPVTIASSDDDLLQLLDGTTEIYNLSKKRVYTASDMFADHNIDPEHWPQVKAITGCSGDSLPGIVGVGEKSAIQYINGELASKSKRFKDIESKAGRGIIERNLPLVTLPLKGMPRLPEVAKDKFNLFNFKRVCHKYGLSRWQHDNDWEIYFNETD